ncbi:SulP family inorganic anion transporter [Promicromonospora sp. NPDC050262]|uniref:SulP family inorganic anion transporter n=1 Tax=Promicromonospora sp. NPDC050262 TaxID=3155036 RepID=UPI0033C12672
MTRFLAPSFSGYRRTSVRPDLLAGLAVWAVLVPESLAYAAIAGVPPVVGLYAAVPALALYALAGTSRQLVVSPMSATAALSAGIVAGIAGDGDPVALTTALALATGIVAVLAGLLRLGFLAAFISEPVLKGFIIGLALTIMIGQVPDLIGVDGGSGNFFQKTWAVLGQLGDIDALTIVVGLASLAALVVLRRTMPLLPGSLVVVLLAIGATVLFGLDDRGLAVVGHIDAGLPQAGIPDVTGPEFAEILGGAVGLMLVGFAEGLGAAKTYAAGQGYDIDPNRELVGLGLSNLGSGFLSGMVVNGSLSKTAVSAGAGARSQFSALTAAALTVVTLLFLTGLFERLPEATLAAVVVAAVVELVDVRSLRRLWRVRTSRMARVYQVTARADFMGAAAALLGVLVFETLPGLVIGIAVSLILLLARTSRPRIATLAPVGDEPGRPWVDAARNPRYPAVPGILAVRVEAPLLFANAEYVRFRVRELAAQTPGLRLVVLDGRATPSIDVTAAAMLVQLRSDLQGDGCDLALAEGIGQVRDVLARIGAKGEPHLYTTLDDAVRAGRADHGPA